MLVRLIAERLAFARIVRREAERKRRRDLNLWRALRFVSSPLS
jgi:hypothetical protein